MPCRSGSTAPPTPPAPARPPPTPPPPPHAPPPCHRRTPLRHDQGLDGSNPLQDPDPRQGQNGNEPPRPGLQSETGGRHARPAVADRGDPGLNGPAIPDTATETSSGADDTAAFSHSLGHKAK